MHTAYIFSTKLGSKFYSLPKSPKRTRIGRGKWELSDVRSWHTADIQTPPFHHRMCTVRYCWRWSSNLQTGSQVRCNYAACAESFLHSMKVECVHGVRFASREIMRTTVFNYVECDYNRWRRHSTCGGLSPVQFENQTLA